MLKSFWIPYLDGKVCYLDDTGKIPTIECYSRRIAFRFDASRLFPIKIGEWIRFRGQVRAATKLNKHGLVDGVRTYYHEPGDGLPKSDWLFFELLDVEYKRIGPLDVIDALRECSNMCRRFLDSWEANDDVKQLRNLIHSLLYAADVVRPVLKQKVIDEEERKAVVKTIDLGNID